MRRLFYPILPSSQLARFSTQTPSSVVPVPSLSSVSTVLGNESRILRSGASRLQRFAARQPAIRKQPTKKQPGNIRRTRRHSSRLRPELKDITVTLRIRSRIASYNLHHEPRIGQGDVASMEFDLNARPCKVVGRLGEDVMAEVPTRLGAIFGI